MLFVPDKSIYDNLLTHIFLFKHPSHLFKKIVVSSRNFCKRFYLWNSSYIWLRQVFIFGTENAGGKFDKEILILESFSASSLWLLTPFAAGTRWA